MKNKVLIFLIFVFSAGLFCFAKQEETLPQLIARADAASAGQQADLCMEVAEREVKLAVAAYKGNKSDEGRDALQQIVKYAEKGIWGRCRWGRGRKTTRTKWGRWAHPRRALNLVWSE